MISGKHNIIHGRHRSGRYCVTLHAQNPRALVEWIEAHEFRRFEDERYHLKRCFGRRRSQLYGIPLPGMQGEAVMKMSTIHPAYKLSRRTELFLRSLYRDYNKAAFKYALALLNAGVPVAEPFAFWSDRRSQFDRRSYLLCRKVPGGMTLHDLLQKISQQDDEATQYITHSICRRLIEIMRKMHAARLRHGDPHPIPTASTQACAIGGRVDASDWVRITTHQRRPILGNTREASQIASLPGWAFFHALGFYCSLYLQPA